jgi:Zn-finger nucleic acid-binding protein
MICPNDNTEMGEVKILSHYGGPIFVDQCDRCGGIWFDESELFRARQGEAEKIEAANTEALLRRSAIETYPLVCPRDKGAMQRFADKHFPEDIVLVRCQVCHGIWLNRGVFTKYQQFRQKSVPSRGTTKYEETEAYLAASYGDGLPAETRGRLEEFLSASVQLYKRSRDPYGIGSIAESIAGFLATTITKLLFPGWME